MALWGNTDSQASAPKFVALASNGAYANALFDQVTDQVGVFGVDAAESQVARTAGKPAAQGWVLQRYGTGGVATIAKNNGGTSYVNTQVVTLSNGTVNATATITTNATGGVTDLTLTNSGSGFANSGQIRIQVANTTTTSNSTNGNTSSGTGLTLTLTFNGQAGRVHKETLVAMTAHPDDDASDDAQYPDT
jgi:hypothetical protein